VRVLVQAGADPHGRSISMDWSPVDEALERGGDPNVVAALVGDPNGRNGDGRTPLHVAAADEQADWLDALIGAGGDPNIRDKDGKTPLHCATTQPCVDVLIAGGADPTIADKDGNTPALILSE